MMLTHLIHIIKRTYCQIMNVWAWLKTKMSDYKKKKSDEEEDKTPRYYYDKMIQEFKDMDGDDENKWEEVITKDRRKLDKEIAKTKTIDNFPRSYVDNPLRHRYHIIGTTLNLLLDVSTKYVGNNTWIKTERNKNLTYASRDNMAVIVSSIKMFNTIVTVVPAHALQYMSFEEITKYHLLNPMIYIDKRPMRKLYPTLSKMNQEAKIYTISANTQEYYIIISSIAMLINVQMKIEGRNRLCTIGIIMHIEQQNEVIWSGSLVTVGQSAYIISSVTEIDNGINIIIAWGISSHDINAIIE